MRKQLIVAFVLLAIFLSACGTPNPQPPGLTPVPTLAGRAVLTPVSSVQPAGGGGPTIETGVPATGGVTSGAQANAAIGAAIFLNNCSPCHGNQGQGVDAPALRNNQYVGTTNPQDIAAVVANGLPNSEMPAWLQNNGGPLNSNEIGDVVAYIKTLQGVSPVATEAPQPEEPTATPPPAGSPTEEPARPSNSGEAGNALKLVGNPDNGRPEFGLYCAACHGPEGVQGIPNPGSDDGSVPELNPIDPTIVSQDPKTFAYNLDLFIEHGSVPEGPAPLIAMPAFGDHKLLSDQQIIDIITFVIKLNGVNPSQ